MPKAIESHAFHGKIECIAAPLSPDFPVPYMDTEGARATT